VAPGALAGSEASRAVVSWARGIAALKMMSIIFCASAGSATRCTTRSTLCGSPSLALTCASAISTSATGTSMTAETTTRSTAHCCKSGTALFDGKASRSLPCALEGTPRVSLSHCTHGHPLAFSTPRQRLDAPAQYGYSYRHTFFLMQRPGRTGNKTSNTAATKWRMTRHSRELCFSSVEQRPDGVSPGCEVVQFAMTAFRIERRGGAAPLVGLSYGIMDCEGGLLALTLERLDEMLEFDTRHLAVPPQQARPANVSAPPPPPPPPANESAIVYQTLKPD
jgi:hypothetical protein